MSQPHTVLIVDDEPLVRDVVKMALEEAGFGVMTACDGDEALSLVMFDYPFDVLLTDVRMPGKHDGWSLAEKAREWRPELPVVYVSAYSSEHREVEGSVFVSKP